MDTVVQAKSLKEKMAEKKLEKKTKLAQRKFNQLKPEDQEFNWVEVHHASGIVRDLLIANASILTMAQQLTADVVKFLPADFKVRYDTVAFDTNSFSAKWVSIAKLLKPGNDKVELEDIDTIYVIYEQLNELQLDIRNATTDECMHLSQDIQTAINQYKQSLEQEKIGE